MRLLFFTESYPFGLGEEWKTNELYILSQYFEEIRVIPFHFGGNINPIDVPAENISVSLPLFKSIPKTSWLSIAKVLMWNPRIALTDLLQSITKGRLTFANFRQSCSIICELLSHEEIQNIQRSSYSLGYFFGEGIL